MIDDFQRPPARKPTRLDSYGQPLGNAASPRSMQNLSPDISPRPAQTSQTYSASMPLTAAQPFSADRLYEPVDQDVVLPDNSDKKRRFAFKKPTRKQAILLGVGFIILIGSGAAYALTRPDPEPAPKPVVAKVVPKPQPKPITSPLTGLVVTAEQQARPVTGVMIENSTNARPQSGLKDAGVVFEAIAEAGITRFLALYQEAAPGNIGPVRSARPYFLDWAMAFDASYAHVGGSPDALNRIKEIGTKDLDQFHNPGAYHRISSRYAPHNVYTSMDALVNAGNAKGFTKSTFTGFERKAKEEPSKAPTAKTINFGISSALYNSQYTYDPATNGYKRNMAGAPHIDFDSKAQLQPKVVVGLVMPYGLMADGYHSTYTTTGTGLAYFFQDGIVTTGSWSKAEYKTQFVFKDDAGNPIKLNPGQTWVSVVGDPAKVSYTP